MNNTGSINDVNNTINYPLDGRVQKPGLLKRIWLAVLRFFFPSCFSRNNESGQSKSLAGRVLPGSSSSTTKTTNGAATSALMGNGGNVGIGDVLGAEALLYAQKHQQLINKTKALSRDISKIAFPESETCLPADLELVRGQIKGLEDRLKSIKETNADAELHKLEAQITSHSSRLAELEAAAEKNSNLKDLSWKPLIEALQARKGAPGWEEFARKVIDDKEKIEIKRLQDRLTSQINDINFKDRPLASEIEDLTKLDRELSSKESELTQKLSVFEKRQIQLAEIGEKIDVINRQINLIEQPSFASTLEDFQKWSQDFTDLHVKLALTVELNEEEVITYTDLNKKFHDSRQKVSTMLNEQNAKFSDGLASLSLSIEGDDWHKSLDSLVKSQESLVDFLKNIKLGSRKDSFGKPRYILKDRESIIKEFTQKLIDSKQQLTTHRSQFIQKAEEFIERKSGLLKQKVALQSQEKEIESECSKLRIVLRELQVALTPKSDIERRLEIDFDIHNQITLSKDDFNALEKLERGDFRAEAGLEVSSDEKSAGENRFKQFVTALSPLIHERDYRSES